MSFSPPVLIGNFSSVAPRFRKKQEEGLLWLVEAHVQAERERRGLPPDSDQLEDFRHKLVIAFRRFGCTPPRVSYRSHEHDDFNHYEWKRMDVFQGMTSRTRAFQQGARRAFQNWYGTALRGPRHLLHVSCTGYLSPSAAQEVVVNKGWNESTTVTHVYHMGCYAAFPAIRIGAGLLGDGSPGSVDVAHTELCTLHLNPSHHEPENLVMQSLFGDGLMKYSLWRGDELPEERPTAAWKLLALHEETVPDSDGDMTWIPVDWGIQMTLSKEVPAKIGRAMRQYELRLLSKAGLSEGEVELLRPTMQYAIHPGGPRIIDQVQDILRLMPEQVSFSREVLAQYGNMSSATLPHVWQAMLESSKVAEGQRVVSFAFGPGLTISGGVFEKVIVR